MEKVECLSFMWGKVPVTFRYSRKQTPLSSVLSHSVLGHTDSWERGSRAMFFYIPHIHPVAMCNILFNYSVEAI